MIINVPLVKVNGYGNGRNNCMVEIEIGWREFANQEPYFTVCADLWNHLHTDILEGGQCLDSLWEQYDLLKVNGVFQQARELWKKYHLKPKSKVSEKDIKKINDFIAFICPSDYK